MKKEYIKPLLVLVEVNEIDIVTASGFNGFEGDDQELGARQRRTSIWDDEF